MACVPRNHRWPVVAMAGLGLVAGLLAGCGQADGSKAADGDESDPIDSLDKNPEPAAAGDCEAELLDWPTGDPAEAEIVVSSDGAYAAVAVAGTGDFVLWHEGEAKVVTALGESSADIRLYGVNSRGLVVGQDYGGDTAEAVRFTWDAGTGKLHELGGAGQGWSGLAGINDDGTIVESEQRIADEPFYGNEVAIWPKGSGEAEMLKLDSKKRKATKVTAISNEGLMAGALFDGESVEMGGEYSFLPRIWRPDGTAVEVPVDEFDALAIDIAGGWVVVSAETDYYRWKFTTDEKPDKLKGFNGRTVDEPGRVYGSIGSEDEAVPAVFDTRAHKLPVPEDAPTAATDPQSHPVPHTVADASLDGSVLVGTWKGNPVKWTCQGS